jgi:Flp pilus assembly protein TadG
MAQSGLARCEEKPVPFARDERGTVAVIFALSLVPLIAFGGVALDYARGSLARARLDNAIDAAVLGAAQEGGAKFTEATLAEAIEKRLAPMKGPLQLNDLQITTHLDVMSSTLTANVTGKMQTTIASIIGIKEVSVGSSSTASWKVEDVEVALVLDNTGSMAESGGRGRSGTPKIESLTRAAKNFVHFMKGLVGNKPDTIEIAVVPFDTGVQLDNQLSRSFWVHKDRDTEKGSWSGCIHDRDQPHDVLDTAPTTGQPATLYKADPNRTANRDCTLSPVTPLTSNLGSLNGPLDSMKASGATNLTIGLAWGFHVLTPSEPILNAAPLKSSTQKFIILMTDGQNTQNRWTGNSRSIDARTAAVCANIKEAGIQIYTIGTPDADASLLRSCASSPDMYYGINDGSEMEPVFQRIASRISQLRIAK